jgi:ribosomal protein S18 acetylase RimI-like enzyme
VPVELEPAASVELGDLATLFTRSYDGYYVPFRIDEDTLRFMVAAFHLDLEASRVARLSGELVGLANLAVRGHRGWVGGIGVVPRARRLGVAEALMTELLEAARARDVHRVTLEVIEQNEPAQRLYEKLGFETTRELEIWSLAQSETTAKVRDVALEDARARIRELRGAAEPWQREDETVTYYATLEPPPGGVGVDGGAAVYRESDAGLQLVQIAGDAVACRALLEALRSRGSVGLLNLPKGDPAGRALRELGGECAFRQREMALAL